MFIKPIDDVRRVFEGPGREAKVADVPEDEIFDVAFTTSTHDQVVVVLLDRAPGVNVALGVVHDRLVVDEDAAVPVDVLDVFAGKPVRVGVGSVGI